MSRNIILVSWDSVRADHLPVYGYERDTTPKLREIAEDGLVFDDAHIPGVGTPTSFTGMFTGEHAHGSQLCIEPEHWREANKNRTLLSEVLQDEGYYTGAIHANALMSRFYGWDRGWDHFEDNLWTETPTQGGRKDGKELRFRTMIQDDKRWWTAIKKTILLPNLRKVGLAGWAIHAKNIAYKQQAYARWEQLWNGVQEFIETAPEPWFLWVLLVDTHHPWTAPGEYQKWPQPGFRTTNAWNFIMRRWPKFTGYRKPEIVNAYDNELRHADAFLERLDQTLEREGYGDASLIVHSDHGDELGEHCDYGHAPAMWDTVTRVPVVMRNVGEIGRVPGPHTLKDLGSTVLDIAGSDHRLNDRPSMLADERPGHDKVYIENRRMDGKRLAAAVGAAGWKVMYLPDGIGFRAFDRDQDPEEQVDVWGSEMPEPARELESWLQEKLRETDGSVVDARGGEMTAETQERLADLGYID